MRTYLITLFCLALSSICQAAQNDARTDRVLTQQQQADLSAIQIIQIMRDGNNRFVTDSLTSRDHSLLVRDAVAGQFPKTMVLSCIDSRIPVEDVFDLGIGDAMVARVAGNFENTDILGSMEFATKVSGAKVVLVLGHEECGAIKAAIDDAQLGNITAMLENIKPAVDSLADYDGEKSSSNPDFVHLVAVRNVELTISRIRERSAIIRTLEAEGELLLAGALYDMKTGVVEFLE